MQPIPAESHQTRVNQEGYRRRLSYSARVQFQSSQISGRSGGLAVTYAGGLFGDLDTGVTLRAGRAMASSDRGRGNYSAAVAEQLS